MTGRKGTGVLPCFLQYRGEIVTVGFAVQELGQSGCSCRQRVGEISVEFVTDTDPDSDGQNQQRGNQNGQVPYGETRSYRCEIHASASARRQYPTPRTVWIKRDS